MEIRLATDADHADLEALAGRDSAVVPSGSLLLAYEGGALVAALSLGDGSVIADPFKPTTAVVSALRAYASDQPISLHLSKWLPGRRLALAGVSATGSGSPRKSTVRSPVSSPSA